MSRARRKDGWRRGVSAILAAGALAGCSMFRVRQEQPPLHDKPPEDHQLLSVPFFPDGTDQCGPSAEAAVLSYWGAPVDAGALKSEVYSQRLQGSFSLDLLLAAQHRGFKAHLYQGSLEDLKA